MSSAWGRLLCLVILLFAPGALAQSSASTPLASTRAGDPAYDGLIEKAVAEFNLGHWGEAKAFFLRAHQLRPNARTLRSLGHTSYELRLYVDAIGYFRQALRSEEQPLTPQLRANVEQQLAEARSFVTHVQLQLEPAHVAVRVDGRDAVFDDDGTLLLDPGLHELAASAPEYEPQVRTISAHGAERRTLTFSLSPVHRSSVMPTLEPEQPVLVESAPLEPPLSAAPEAHDAPEPTREPSSSLTTQQWVGIGLSAAGVVAGGVALGFSLAAASENDVSKRTCNANGCNDAGRDARESALAHADVATVSVITAALGVIWGAKYYFASPSSERQTASLHIAPVANAKTAGLIMSGRF